MKNHSPVRRAANRKAAQRKSHSVSGQSSSAEYPFVQSPARTDSFLSKRVLLACLILIMASVIVYAPVRHFQFVNWDDPGYVTENLHVAGGMTWHGVLWALASGDAANWHPLTWLSHMLDVQLYGMNAGPQHVMNLLIHILNTLLLFGLLYRMTAAFGRSTFVAALFAIHPLHVESVAWISERKDVLSAFFWMLTILAYVAYVRRPRLGRYLLALLLFGLGLMAKPMLVTLPCVLLLLDFWPLRRIELGTGVGRFRLGALWRRKSEPLRLVWEKLPLLVLSMISCVVTVLVQRHGGAVAGLVKVPLSIRLPNATASYLAYIGKTLWPVRLAAFYPLQAAPPALQASLGALLLIGVTALAIRTGRRCGYLPVGWLWYVGTLIPVIGLVQVGDQSMADRYTYLPLIGLLIVAAWGAPELAARWRPGRFALPVAAVCSVVACAALARAQVRYWSDSTTLWQHALDVTEDNYGAHTNLGSALMNQGRTDEAVPHFVEALRIKPGFISAQNNMGLALMAHGELDEAARLFDEALRIKPDFFDARSNLGLVLMRKGKPDEAAQCFGKALRIKPDSAEAQNNLASALMGQGELDEAARRFGQALRLKPDLVEAHNGLGAVLLQQGKLDEAAQHFREALRLKPDSAKAQNNLGVALMGQGKLDEAARHFSQALRLKPDFVEASNNLKLAVAKQGEEGR